MDSKWLDDLKWFCGKCDAFFEEPPDHDFDKGEEYNPLVPLCGCGARLELKNPTQIPVGR